VYPTIGAFFQKIPKILSANPDSDIPISDALL
jgi:hypothetical protein